jgi:adenylate kinase family enzyme
VLESSTSICFMSSYILELHGQRMLNMDHFLQLSDAVTMGKLVPDEVIFSLLTRRLERGMATGERGFILDGFPRTISQAVKSFF